MTATAIPTIHKTTETTETSTVRPVWRTGVRVALVAAAATTAIAAAALAAGVPLTVGGEQIPVLGFAQLTLVCAAIGVVLAKVLRSRKSFVRTTMALTALSFFPDVTASASAATKLTLMLTHLVAAAIVIP